MMSVTMFSTIFTFLILDSTIAAVLSPVIDDIKLEQPIKSSTIVSSSQRPINEDIGTEVKSRNPEVSDMISPSRGMTRKDVTWKMKINTPKFRIMTTTPVAEKLMNATWFAIDSKSESTVPNVSSKNEMVIDPATEKYIELSTLPDSTVSGSVELAMDSTTSTRTSNSVSSMMQFNNKLGGGTSDPFTKELSFESTPSKPFNKFSDGNASPVSDASTDDHEITRSEVMGTEETYSIHLDEGSTIENELEIARELSESGTITPADEIEEVISFLNNTFSNGELNELELGTNAEVWQSESSSANPERIVDAKVTTFDLAENQTEDEHFSLSRNVFTEDSGITFVTGIQDSFPTIVHLEEDLADANLSNMSTGMSIFSSVPNVDENTSDISTASTNFEISTAQNFSDFADMDNSSGFEIHHAHSDESTAVSADIETTTVDKSSDAPKPSCPPPGLCLMWFLAEDACAVDSHCLGSRICCKIRCSKACIDV